MNREQPTFAVTASSFGVCVRSHGYGLCSTATVATSLRSRAICHGGLQRLLIAAAEEVVYNEHACLVGFAESVVAAIGVTDI